MLDFASLIAQHDIQNLALGGLLDGQGGLGNGFGPGRRLVGLHLTGADVQRAVIGRRLGPSLPHDDEFTLQCRTLKAVRILHIDGFTINPCHATASHIVEEAHDIVNLYHNSVVLILFF